MDIEPGGYPGRAAGRVPAPSIDATGRAGERRSVRLRGGRMGVGVLVTGALFILWALALFLGHDLGSGIVAVVLAALFVLQGVFWWRRRP